MITGQDLKQDFSIPPYTFYNTPPPATHLPISRGKHKMRSEFKAVLWMKLVESTPQDARIQINNDNIVTALRGGGEGGQNV